MKIKSIFMIGVLVLTLVTASAIYADTVVVGNSSFSIPDGYTVVENGTQTILYNDDVAITMYQGPIIDPSEAKQKRISSGYTFIEDADYEYAGATINQQNYKSDGVYTCVYTLEKNNKTYIITLNVDEKNEVPSNEDNPVTEIIRTLN